MNNFTNIDKCTIEEIGEPVIGYKITAMDGWGIYTSNSEDNKPARSVVVGVNYDISNIQVLEVIEETEGD